ncbi:MAG: pyridoxamine 5'-phosphate oxidase family protein [Actinomycetota bacterium]|nr:pyridoxamine 5'-phosphate oxidase family protein [Actinomycetota bacterium]
MTHGVPLAQLSPAGLAFVAERHLGTFASVRPDGTLHVTPVGFTWDPEQALARVITSGSSRKARNAVLGGPVAICQVDGRRWLTMEGTPSVRCDPDAVAAAVLRYAQRYRTPRVNPARVAIEVRVTRLLGSAEFL